VTKTSNAPSLPLGPGFPEQLPGSWPLDLRSLGLVEESGALDMTGMIGHLLLVEAEGGKTWAQRMGELWIVEALRGNARAIEDILDRMEKGRVARTSATAAATPTIDDETARKILEILSGPGEEATSARCDRASPEPPAEGPEGAPAADDRHQRDSDP
jgi:hypothetical protein